MKITTLATIAILTLSCSNNSEDFNKTHTTKIIHVKLNQKPKLSEFVKEIKYHQLPKEVKAGYFDKVIVTKDFYLFADYEIGMNIHILDKKFNFVSKIDNYGEGPGQYQRIKGVSYNEDLDLIEILTNKDIIQFSINGEHINSIKIPFSFGNLLAMPKEDYLIYNNNSSSPSSVTDHLFTLWNYKTHKFTPIIKQRKNELVNSFIDRNTLYQNKNEIFATHIFLDTIYKMDNNKITKYLLNLDNLNLPYNSVKFDSKNSYTSILDNEELMQNYAFHYPILMASDHFLIDGYIYKNNISFFILNRTTGNVVAGRQVTNDVDFGINYILPRFIDNQNSFYTLHQYEELKDLATQNNLDDSDFNKFTNTLDPDTGFIVIEYKLKSF